MSPQTKYQSNFSFKSRLYSTHSSYKSNDGKQITFTFTDNLFSGSKEKQSPAVTFLSSLKIEWKKLFILSQKLSKED